MTTVLRSEIVSVYVIFGSDEEARRIGRAMIEQRLAACVNILGPCHSIYRWQGKVEQADEVAAIFKTSFDTAPDLLAAIQARHSYDLPAMAVHPISLAGFDFAAWVAENTR